MIEATMDAGEAEARVWEVVVVGAGPAGAMAALRLARHGARVLLLDRKAFPRDKLCGGCLNGETVSALRAEGLGPALDRLGGHRLERFCLSAGRPVTLALPAGLALSRRRLDGMLVKAAIEAGAAFMPGVRAVLADQDSPETSRRIHCVTPQGSRPVRSRVVIVAAGLGAAGSCAIDPRLAALESPQTRIGVGTIATSAPDAYAAGTISMAVGREGYVGLTRVEDGRLNIAAALDAHCLRLGNPATVCHRILEAAGFPVAAGMLAGRWRGTPGLSREPAQPACNRVFLVGDAAGYVEPFTGEGMAWAIASGQAVVPLAMDAVATWDPELARRWSGELAQLLAWRRRVCRAIAWGLRRPVLVRGTIGLLGALPWLARPLIQRLNRERDREAVDPRTGHSRAA